MMYMRAMLLLCGLVLLCPACQSIRRDSQYQRQKAAVSATISAEIAGVISLSFSRCVVYDTDIKSVITDSITAPKITEHF